MRKTPDDTADGKGDPDEEADNPNSFVGLALFPGGREAGNYTQAVGDRVQSLEVVASTDGEWHQEDEERHASEYHHSFDTESGLFLFSHDMIRAVYRSPLPSAHSGHL